MTPPPAALLSTRKALRFFNLFRIALVAVLLLMTQWVLPEQALDRAALGQWALAYGALVVAGALVGRLALPLSWLLTATLAADIVLISSFTHLYGGVKSGFGMLLLPFLAVAGMLVSGRLALFYAALATFSLFASVALNAWHDGLDSNQLLQAALLAIAGFVTSATTWLLSRKARQSELLAALRGSQLASLNRVNALALQALREAVLVLDAQGVLRQFNATASRLLGELQRDRLQPVLQPLIRRWHLQGMPLQEQEIDLVLRGQQLIGRMVPLAEDDSLLLVVFLQPAEQLAAEAQQLKLAALGRLTANIAHEIRNPLAAISHAAELLGEEAVAPVTQRLSSMVRDNCARIEHLVAEVLQLNRRDRVHGEVFLLRPFVDELIASFLLAHPEYHGRLGWQVEATVAVRFDRSHLQRILTNLLANACRHGSAQPGAVQLVATAQRLTVLDDGPGLDAAAQGRLFEPFFTTESSGTGLGLYIARELAQANGAQLSYQPPGGCFQLTFPESHDPDHFLRTDR